MIARLTAWLGAWKYVLILLALLGGSLWLNLHLYGKSKTAKAECRTQMVEAARVAIENERERAAKAEKRAGEIVDKNKKQTRDAVHGAQEDTNARGAKIDATPVHGDCRMPGGLPSLAPAVAAANAAAGD